MIQKQFFKIRSLFFLFSCIASFSLYAQRVNLDDLKLISPHLPALIISEDGTKDVLVGNQITLQKKSTISSIKNIEKWMEEYPKELSMFKKLANDFFRLNKEENISKDKIEIYNDFKSIWLFVNQFDKQNF
ncbi:MAG: hypothetical protein KGZ59_02715 [Chitinophagaceae bacterium]|nr:hypothetical protein [Chitinophagaceae bacterium]